MLRELVIHNLALIEEMRLHFPGKDAAFPRGLVVFTGETGAGKSILLQAINLLAGGRAAATWIRTGAEQASVEALFELRAEHAELLALVAGHGIETDGELILRRVLSAQGKSRFYVNGALGTARLAAEICAELINIAGQHDQQQLLNPNRHLDFIDSLGDHWPARRNIARLHHRWQETRSRLEELGREERDKERRRDYLCFQVNEISEVAPEPGEDDALAEERARLRSADALLALGHKSHHLLSGPLSDAAGQLRRQLEQITALDPTADAMAEEIAGLTFQLEDQADGLRRYCEGIPKDPARLELVEERLDLLQRLKRKYAEAGDGLAGVLAYAQRAEEELTGLDRLDAELEQLGAERKRLESELATDARALSAARHTTAAGLASAMQAELAGLCLEQAVFSVAWPGEKENGLILDRLTASGIDRPEFLFSANPGEAPKPLARIASGGELSRLILALKCLLARKDAVNTIIFDEVDAGVGGRTAEAVARKIKELASHHQVLCVTHLPQIAGCADEHFKVEKTVRGDRTHTAITPLPGDARVLELARMLAGDSVTPHTLAFARELMAKNPASLEQ